MRMRPSCRRGPVLLSALVLAAFAGAAPTVAQSPSPGKDEGLIVFGTEGSTHCQTFHTIRPDGSQPTQLAGDCGPQNHVRWLPGSAGVIYDRGPDPARNLFVSAPDGTEPRAITAVTDGTLWSPSVSADGTTMIYERDTLNTARGIFLADPDGTHERQLTVVSDPVRGYDGSPDLSPDGSTIVFTRVTGPNTADLWLIDADGKGLRRLTHGLPFPDYPRWSPDGRRVLFATDLGVGSISTVSPVGRVPSGGRVGGPPEDVARLAIEHPAHRVQGGEADGSGPSVFEHRDVRRGDADGPGEVAHGHLASGEHDVELDDEGHQMTQSSSARSAVAASSSPRMTIMSSTNASVRAMQTTRR